MATAAAGCGCPRGLGTTVPGCDRGNGAAAPGFAAEGQGGSGVLEQAVSSAATNTTDALQWARRSGTAKEGVAAFRRRRGRKCMVMVGNVSAYALPAAVIAVMLPVHPGSPMSVYIPL